MTHPVDSTLRRTGSSTDSFDQAWNPESDKGAVQQGSRRFIEMSFEAICRCLDAQDFVAEAQARLDTFGSESLWQKLRADAPEQMPSDVRCKQLTAEAFLLTSDLQKLLELLRISKAGKGAALDHERAEVEEIEKMLKAESDKFMREVLARVRIPFRYKQRWHFGGVVHLVVLREDAKAAAVLSDLRRLNVDIEHPCPNVRKGERASTFPIHLAAGGGHVDTLKKLIELGAEVDAKTILRKDHADEPYYTALHEACFFQRIDAVTVLIESKADINCENFHGNTPLHLAAKYAPPLVEALLEKQADINAENREGRRPLDLAIRFGSFPVGVMHTLTNYSLDDLLRVARQSPLAAGELMRDSSSDDWECKVDLRWSSGFAKEIKAGRNACHIWCQLMEDAPQAAEDMLEALTLEPQVEDRFYHPLPRYAMLRSNEILRSHYAPDHVWRYNADKMPTFPAWHQDASTGLAPQLLATSWIDMVGLDNDAGNVSINIKVLMIPDMLCPEVFLRLKTTTHLHIFVKIAVRAILDAVWQKGVATFYFVKLGHKSLVIVVLLWWALGPPSHGFGVRATWSFLFATSCRELCYQVLEICGCLRLAIDVSFSSVRSRDRTTFNRFIQCWLTFENVFDLMTTSLLLRLVMYLWGRVDAGQLAAFREMFAVVVLTRWLQLAGAFRAFPSVGLKLLPIVQSVAGTGGIILLTGLTFSAFWHAFCALGAPEMTITQLFVDSVRFLLVGDGDGIDMVLGLSAGSVDEPSPWAVMILVSALLLFCILLMNIFIATIDQAYEQALESVQARFLQERASLCFECLILSYLRRGRDRSLNLSAAKLLSILLIFILPAWLGMIAIEWIPIWVPSSMLAVALLSLDVALVSSVHLDVPGMVAQQQRQFPDVSETSPQNKLDSGMLDGKAGPSANSVPLPHWAQSLSAPLPSGSLLQQQVPQPPLPSVPLPQQQEPQAPLCPPPPLHGAATEQLDDAITRDDISGTHLDKVIRSPTNWSVGGKKMYFWICHREVCTETDLWPAARSADSVVANLEGRVCNLKRDAMVRSKKRQIEISDLRGSVSKVEGSVSKVEGSVSKVKDQLDRIEEVLSRRDREAAQPPAPLSQTLPIGLQQLSRGR